MQFKKVGNRIQVLAYFGYDKIKRRSIIKQIASLDASTLSMSVSDGVELTVEQKGEIQSEIDRIVQQRKNLRLQLATESLASRINNVSDSLASGNNYMSGHIANSLYVAISDLQRALKRAGFKPRPKQGAGGDTKTASLPLDAE